MINTTLFLFYARIYYQFKPSELKNCVEKVVEQAVQALNVLLEWTWNVPFLISVKLHSWLVVHESEFWSLESP